MVTVESTLGDLVIEHPRAARVLYRHHLDFCCGGRRTLADACTREGLVADRILQEIDMATADPAEVRAEELTPAQLVDFIIKRYHDPLREEVPRLIELARKVERVHAAKPECPTGVAAHLSEMHLALDSHLAKEEQMLFPMIRAGRGHLAYMPVQVMMQEHDDHAANLQRMHVLAHDFVLPPDACTSWRNLYDSLQALELELMRHIHTENNILFPAVLAA